MAEVDELFWTLKADTTQLTRGVGAAQGRMKKFTAFMKSPAGPIAAIAALSAVLVTFGIKMGKMAGDLDKALREVGTLLPGTVADLQDVRKEIIAMSTRVPLPPVQLTKAMYQAVSAGARDTKEALMLVEVASKAAVAGLTDAFTAVDAITTILNAYQMSAHEAERVSDVLFKTVEQGKIRFEELSSVIGNVATTAALMGVTIEEVGASLAVLTKFGLSAAESTTALNRFMLTAVQQTDDMVASAKEMGIEFTTYSDRTRTFTSFLIALNEATDGQVEKLAKLFPNIRAARAAFVEAAGGQEEYLRILKEQQAALGTTQTAFDEMMGSLDNQTELLKNKVTAEFLYFGQYVLEGVLLPALAKLNELLPETEGGLSGVLNRLEQMGQYKGDIRSLMETFIWFGTGAWGGQAMRGTLFTGRGAQSPIGQMMRRGQEGRLAETTGLQDVEALLYPSEEARGRRVPEERLRAAKEAVEAALAEIDDVRDDYHENVVRRIEDEGRQALEWIDHEMRAYSDARDAKGRADEAARKKEQLALEAAAKEAARLAEESAEKRSAIEENVLAQVEEVTMTAAEQSVAALQRVRDKYIELLGGADEYYQLISEGESEQARRAAALENNIGFLERQIELEGRRKLIQEELARIAEEQARAFDEIEVRNAHILDAAEREATINEEKRAHLERAHAEATKLLEVAGDDEEARTLINDHLRRMIKLLQRALGLQRSVTKETEAERKAREKAAAEQRLNDQLRMVQLIEQAARGAIDFAENMGIVNEEIADAARGFAQLAEGALTLAAGIATMNVGAMISGGLGLLGGISNLFGGGESPEAKAMREALERNGEALDRLTRSVDQQRQLALRAEGSSAAVLQQLFAGLDDLPAFSFFNTDAPEEFNRRMREMGLTVEDVTAMIEDLGLPVQLVIEDGYIAGESLRQVAEALGQFGVGTWAAGFQGQMEALRREFELFDIDDPLEQLKMIRDEFSHFTDLEMPDFDLDTAEGREAFERWIQEMFTRSQLPPMFGGLTFEDLGDMSTQELLDTFGTMENLLDQIAKDEETATDAEGQTTSFQTVSRITLEQAGKLIAQGTTQIHYLRRITEALEGGPEISLADDVILPEIVDKPPVLDPGFWNTAAQGIAPPMMTEMQKFVQAFGGQAGMSMPQMMEAMRDEFGDHTQVEVTVEPGAIVVNEAEMGSRTADEILDRLNEMLMDQVNTRRRGTGAPPTRTH